METIKLYIKTTNLVPRTVYLFPLKGPIIHFLATLLQSLTCCDIQLLWSKETTSTVSKQVNVSCASFCTKTSTTKTVKMTKEAQCCCIHYFVQERRETQKAVFLFSFSGRISILTSKQIKIFLPFMQFAIRAEEILQRFFCQWQHNISFCCYIQTVCGNDLIESGVSSPDRRSGKRVFLPHYLLLHWQIIRLLKTSHYQYL